MSRRRSPEATPEVPSVDRERLLFRSGRDGTIRLLAVFSLAVGALMLWLVTMPPGPQAPPESFAERAFAVSLAGLVAVGFPLGMWAYGRRYVSTLTLSADGGTVLVTHVGFFRSHTRRLEVSTLGASRFHQGELRLKQAVNAPWLSIPVRGERGLIIDLQGEFPDEGGWATFLERIGMD